MLYEAAEITRSSGGKFTGDCYYLSVTKENNFVLLYV
jgi:hypothetical protein